MPRRTPNPGAQQVAPQGLPGNRARQRREPLLPRLPLPQLRAVPGAGSPGGLRASGSGGAWWPGESSHPELGPGVRSPSPHLPALPTLAQRVAQNRTRLRSLLLPPLLLAREPRELGPQRRGPGEREDHCRGAAREAPDSLRALLGELLPSRFREFLHQLGAESAEPRAQTPSASRPKRSVSEHCHHGPQCPHCSFLPDLRGQSSYFQNSLKKILLHQIPALGTLRRDHSQFTLKKANHRPHGAQAPKPKAVLTHSSSGESSGHRRRSCPFRVRFADETLRDTALRYWERSCAGYLREWDGSPVSDIRMGVRECREMAGEFAQNPVPRAEDEAVANISFGWDCPGLSAQEPPGHLPEDVSMKHSLPSIPRATTQRPRGDSSTWQDTDNILGQGGQSPCSWSQTLMSTRWQPAARRTPARWGSWGTR